MHVILFDNYGRRIRLFENTLASDYLWCLSRAISSPENISSLEVYRDMEMLPRLRNLLEYSPGLKNAITAYSGEMLISFLCNLDITGVGFIQVLRGNEIVHFRRRRSAFVDTPREIGNTPNEFIFSRGAPPPSQSSRRTSNTPNPLG